MFYTIVFSCFVWYLCNIKVLGLKGVQFPFSHWSTQSEAIDN